MGDKHMLVPLAPGHLSAMGYVHVRGEYHAILIIAADNATSLTGASLSLAPELAALLAGKEGVVLQRLAQCADAGTFCVELVELVGEVEGGGHTTGRLVSDRFYDRVLAELDAVGWDLVSAVAHDLSSLELCVADAAGRQHVATVHLPPDFPDRPPSIACRLPEPFDVRWDEHAAQGGTGRLGLFLDNFRQALARYQDLWTVLDDLDARTAVLDPKNPTRDELSRRLGLGNHASVHLRISARHPRALPELTFLGADTVVGPLREKLNERLALWDRADLVRTNLERILDIALPGPLDGGGAAATAVECGVCYSTDLDGASPECVCDGCRQAFHHSCLLEWLQSLPNCQQSLSTVFGACPYCSRPISVRTTPQPR